jgi:hypothetical protein
MWSEDGEGCTFLVDGGTEGTEDPVTCLDGITVDYALDDTLLHWGTVIICVGG